MVLGHELVAMRKDRHHGVKCVHGFCRYRAWVEGVGISTLSCVNAKDMYGVRLWIAARRITGFETWKRRIPKFVGLGV